MNNKKRLKWIISIGVIILIGLSLGTIGYMYTQVSEFGNRFAENVYIEDLAVGGLTKEEAKVKLEQMISDRISKQSLIFKNEKTSVEVPFSQLGMTHNVDEIIEHAFAVGREGSFFKQYEIAKNGLEAKQNFELEHSINEGKLQEALENCADEFYVAPINATLTRKNRQFITTKEVNGIALNISATKEKAFNLLSEMNDLEAHRVEVEVVMEEVLPEYTEASFEKVQTLVASFSTSYNNSSMNRNENIKVAAKKINRMLLPDEIFYLSNQLEPFTEEQGYKNAGTIVNGKIEDSLGGGICQVSSTLYNAILLTDLEIVSRQNHSLAVSYVPLGRDATYNTGTIDFKFKNNSGYPIFIEAYCENNQVITNIYGHESLKSDYDIKFESEITEVIPAPATKYEDDPTLDEGKEVVETTAIDGKRVNLYKLYYKDGVLKKRVLVNSSYYRARAAVIKRGTKKAVSSETSQSVDQPNTNNTNGNTIGTDSNLVEGNVSSNSNTTESTKPNQAESSVVETPNNNVDPFAVIQQ